MTDLIVSERDNILWAQINRETKANSISRALTDRYVEALDELSQRSDLKGLIWFSSSDDLFSGGVDLKRPDGLDDQQASEYRTAIITDLALATLRCPRPIVTLARGRMIGGAVLNALCCDQIMADTTASFQLPEVKIGIGSPIAGSIVEHSASASLARDMLLTARVMSAAEIAQRGAPCTVVTGGDLEEQATRAIETYAQMPPEAFGYMKAWFQKPRIAALEEAMAYTARSRAGKNDEATRAVSAFFDKG